MNESLRVSYGEAEAGEGVARLGRRGLRRRQELEARYEGAVVRARGAPEPLRRQEDAGDAEAEQHPEVGGRRGRHVGRGGGSYAPSGRGRIRELGFRGGVFEARAVEEGEDEEDGEARKEEEA